MELKLTKQQLLDVFNKAHTRSYEVPSLVRYLKVKGVATLQLLIAQKGEYAPNVVLSPSNVTVAAVNLHMNTDQEFLEALDELGYTYIDEDDLKDKLERIETLKTLLAEAQSELAELEGNLS